MGPGPNLPSCVFLHRGERILFRAFPLRAQEGRKIGSMLVLVEGVPGRCNRHSYTHCITPPAPCWLPSVI